MRLERVRELLQLLLREARPDLADRLEGLGVLVVTREQVRAVHARALALALQRGNGHKVHRVAHRIHVVLLELEPVQRAARGLVVRVVPMQGLDDQPLGRRRDRLVEEVHDLVRVTARVRLGVLELAGRLDEGRIQGLAALDERLAHEALALEDEAVEGEHARFDLDVLLVHVLALSVHQNLEGQDRGRRGGPIDCNGLAVQHARAHAGLERPLDDAHQVRVLRGRVLRVAAVDSHFTALHDVDLRALAVVFVLAGELDVLETVEHLTHAVGWLRKHWLHRDAHSEVAVVVQVPHAILEHRGRNRVVRGHFREALLHDEVRGLEALGDHHGVLLCDGLGQLRRHRVRLVAHLGLEL